ncbi:hypothetical protein CPC08DRAFT_717469 [Agrocybe pediades]|nr:hypothetical protein CPC08DRAFT_717469 [Agrocybe pediades]
MPRPNRRPDVSFKHFRCIGYKAENICTKAELDEYPPIEQDPIDGFSEFDVSKWPKRSVEFGLGFFFKDRCPKGEIPEKFCLNVEDDIVDLCFVVKETTVKQRTVHLYLCRELERRAWEKYGGPTGLEAARKRLQECFLSYPSPVKSCKDGGEQNGESGEEDKAKENDGDSEEEEKEDGGVGGAETPEETVQSQMVRVKHWFVGYTEE